MMRQCSWCKAYWDKADDRWVHLKGDTVRETFRWQQLNNKATLRPVSHTVCPDCLAKIKRKELPHQQAGTSGDGLSSQVPNGKAMGGYRNASDRSEPPGQRQAESALPGHCKLRPQAGTPSRLCPSPAGSCGRAGAYPPNVESPHLPGGPTILPGGAK